MKIQISSIVLALILSAPAVASVSRGYLMTYHGHTSFLGLTNQDVDVQIPLNGFSESQRNVITRCMLQKDQFAVMVETAESSAGVSSDVPGRDTSYHTATVVDVSCVSAPAFLDNWRIQFGLGGK